MYAKKIHVFYRFYVNNIYILEELYNRDYETVKCYTMYYYKKIPELLPNYPERIVKIKSQNFSVKFW